jgi:hypothetical protein
MADAAVGVVGTSLAFNVGRGLVVGLSFLVP